MARINDLVCDRCGLSIGGMELPVVMYVVAGAVTRQADPLFPIGSLPPVVEAMRDLAEPRVEYCLVCFLETYLVHPSEVARIIDLAVEEQLDLRNDRKVQEIRFKRDRLLELAQLRYRTALEAAALALGVIPATTEPGD